MKILFLSVLSIISVLGYSQSGIRIQFVNQDFIKGQADSMSKIKVSINNDLTPEYIEQSTKEGDFVIHFDPALASEQLIIFWQTNENDEDSKKESLVIPSLNSQKATFKAEDFQNSKFYTQALAGRTTRYKATIYNTNFSIPLARFNFTKDSNDRLGNILLFNSIGAGFGKSWGELRETRDENSNIINQEFISTIGLHLGFLFSASTGEDNRNVFAPTFNLSLLDFQLGLGYELGTLLPDQKPLFLTFSYSIPLYKLKKGGFYISKISPPIYDPQEARMGE